MQQHLKWASLSAALTVATAVHAQVTLYVDDDAPPGGDGLSWYSAFNDLQDALATSQTLRTVVEIKVAQGLYLPDRGTGDRNAAFDVGTDGTISTASAFLLQIKGGFAGLGAPAPDAFDPSSFVTVLSGDLMGDDTAEPQSRQDNAYHVMRMQADRARWIQIFDLTIRGGQADGPNGQDKFGAGVFLDQDIHDTSTSASFYNCLITDCHATYDGGGIYVGLAALDINGCTIEACTADTGGGIATNGDTYISLGASSTVANCSAIRGGGISVSSFGTLSVFTSTLAGNSAQDAGGAILVNGSLSIAGSLFAQNTATTGGAIAALLRNWPMTMRSTSMIDNTADVGAALWLHEGDDANILGCVFSNQQASPGGLVWLDGGNVVQIWESCVEGGENAFAGDTSQLAWGVGMLESDPLLVDRAGPDGESATWLDNDYSLSSASPCIDAAPAIGVFPVHGLNGPRPFNSKSSCMTIADMGCYEFLEWISLPPSPRVYVDVSAPSGGDGLSWDTAFTRIEDALGTPNVREVWVASGLYFAPRPGYGDALEISCVNPGVRVLGGFAGWETDESERDPSANSTIISGNQALNEDTAFPLTTEPNTRVFQMEAGQVVVDGFTIDTAGLWLADGDAEFTHCTFTSIDTSTWVDQSAGLLRLTDCSIKANSSYLRADGAVVIDGCIFQGNVADYWATDMISCNGWLDIDRTQFLANAQYDHLVYGRTFPVISNSTFVGNAADGGLIRSRGAGEVTNCAFAENPSAVIVDNYFRDPPMTVTNCWIWHSGDDISGSEHPVVSYSVADYQLFGVQNLMVDDPRIMRLPSPGPDLQWGTADDDFGDLRPANFSPLIDAGDSAALSAQARNFDLAGGARLVDDPSVADTGIGYPVVDIGPYERQAASCLADWNEDGMLDINDAIAFLAAYDAHDPRADLNADGLFGFFDVQMFLNAFAAGCP